MITIKDTCYKGTRILLGGEKRLTINSMIDILLSEGFQEISIPVIHSADIFKNKVGEENNNMMYTLTDRGGRNLALAPEYTAVVQQLAYTRFKQDKDLKLFYVQQCFRGERPQAGRYREFTQLGCEIINPTIDHTQYLINLSSMLIKVVTDTFIVNTNVTRGLDYYKEGKGFEIICEELGSSKQICGGGAYENGIGFAIGIDRLLTLLK